AVCETKNGNVKRIDLPLPTSHARTINARHIADRLFVNILKGDAAPNDSISLLIHNRGFVLYHKPWVGQIENYSFPVNSFPSGISSIILLDSKYDIISERLIFNTNND